MPQNKPKPAMRRHLTLLVAVVGTVIVVIGWAAWKIIAPEAAPGAAPQRATVATFSTLPAPEGASAEEQSSNTFVGASGPDFSLTIFDTGETITLSGLRGQPVILDFFASWCPSCRAEAPFLREFWQTYQDTDLILLGVALNDSLEGLRDFKEEFMLTYPMGLDETGEIAAMYRVGSIPTFVMIDREGRIANVIVGAMSGEGMAAEAEALLK